MRIAKKISVSILRPYSTNFQCNNSLIHYGVKGMKWGVRRDKEKLIYNKQSIVAAVDRKGIKIKNANTTSICRMSDHAGEQAVARRISAKEIIDAISKPLHTGDIIYDNKNRPSQRFIGVYATVNVNPEDGTICTLWRTGTKIRKKYL